MDKVERWIKQKLASYVLAGNGQWLELPETALGQPIYRVTDGPVTLTLSQLGFTYIGPSPPLTCRYDEVEALILLPLRDVMLLRGDLSKVVTVGVTLRGASETVEMQWPFGLYSNVATVLDRIVRELV